MSIESALVTYLLSQTPITAIVGDKIKIDHLRQGVTGPAITWNLVSKDHWHTLDGAAGWAVAQYEIVSWSKDSEECLALAEAVRNALQGYHGTWGSYRIGFVTYASEYIGTDLLNDGSKECWYRVVSDFNVGYAESKPSF